jgi:phosphatidylserine/phosphatidylglycerophosphate/cardiolipin synthase-like enzyme
MKHKPAVFLIAAVIGLATASAAQAGQVVSATPGGTPAEVAFNSGVTYPNGTASYSPIFDDYTIWNQLAKLIDHADNGSTIGLVVHDFDQSAEVVTTALTNARDQRGVHVWVVDNAYHGALSDAVEHYTVCTPCLSNNSDGIQHAKFATFSSTKRRDGTAAPNTTWVTSANLDTRTGKSEFNNAIAYYGNTQLYNGLVKVFQDMWNGPTVFQSSAGADNADYFNTTLPRGFIDASGAATTGYVSPEQQTNLWYTNLSPIQAPTVSGHSCAVRVMHTYFVDRLLDNVSGHDAAHKLVSLKQGGCDVFVLVHREDDAPIYRGPTKIEPDTLNLLCHAGIPVRSIQRMHDKFVISSSDYGSLDNVQEIMTGSHNLTYPALHYNDELLIRISGAPTIYNAFFTHFQEAWFQSWDECWRAT